MRDEPSTPAPATGDQTAHPRAEAGTVLASRFRLEERLGRGGFGEVWLARDTALNRSVAVKLLQPRWRRDPAQQTRFSEEGRLQAQCHHRHIVLVLDVVHDEVHRNSLVLEYVPGPSLRGWLAAQESPVPWRTIVGIVQQLLLALGEVHDQHIVHRDVKPENVLVDDRGETPLVKLTDFGIARPVDSAPRAVETGYGLLGSKYYMAPEQRDGRPVDPATDIFSLCVLFYELLTGRRPEGSGGGWGLVEGLRTPPLGADVPDAIMQVIRRGLRRCPEERYASARAMLEALDRAALDVPAAPEVGEATRGDAEWARDVGPPDESREPGSGPGLRPDGREAARPALRRLPAAATLLVGMVALGVMALFSQTPKKTPSRKTLEAEFVEAVKGCRCADAEARLIQLGGRRGAPTRAVEFAAACDMVARGCRERS